MSQGMPPSPEPDRRQLSLESLEQQLRALPPPVVPDALHSKLIAAIPSAAPAASLATGAANRWPWFVGIGATGILVSALVYVWLTHVNSNVLPKSNTNGSATGTAVPEQNLAGSSQAIRKYEQAVRFDPYNADAWFSLAKAQAEVHRTDDAVSSAQKAINIARSRNMAALAQTVEAWLRTYRSKESSRPPH